MYLKWLILCGYEWHKYLSLDVFSAVYKYLYTNILIPLYTSASTIASSRTSLNENDESESELSSVSRTFVYKPLSIDKEALINTLLMADTAYKEKTELWKTIHEKVKEYNINVKTCQENTRNH